MIKAGIVGVTGYTGIELLRLLKQHPEVTVTYGGTDSYAEQDISDIYPHLKNQVTLKGEKLDVNSLTKNCDVIFISLPHGHAIDIAQPLLAAGKKIIDLGADFRLKNSDDYQQWYQHKPAPTDLLNKAVYGLPEKGVRQSIAQATLIANPGCYPTAAILAALPALKAGIINPNESIFDAKSGLSGAGRSLSLKSHYCEVAENISAYQIAGAHRHTPEIEQELSFLANKPVTIQFTPHLVPMIRGLFVTAYFKLKTSLSQHEAHAIYKETYHQEEFIRVNSLNQAPQVKSVRGTNFCDLGVFVDARTERLIVVSVIDNLIKGAAGQAIQNMNLMYALPEAMGLKGDFAIYP